MTGWFLHRGVRARRASRKFAAAVQEDSVYAPHVCPYTLANKWMRVTLIRPTAACQSTAACLLAFVCPFSPAPSLGLSMQEEEYEEEYEDEDYDMLSAIKVKLKFIFEEMDFTYKVEQKATRESSYTNKYKDAQV